MEFVEILLITNLEHRLPATDTLLSPWLLEKDNKSKGYADHWMSSENPESLVSFSEPIPL